MFQWYVINTYSGHENKVKANLEHRIISMNQGPRFRRVVVPTEQDHRDEGQPEGAVREARPAGLRAREHGPRRRRVDGGQEHARGDRFVGAGNNPVPLSQPEVDRILKTGAALGDRPRAQVEYSLGESVKVTSGPLSDFDGEIVDVNADAQKLKVLVDIFERQVPVELQFDQVKKLD